MDDEPCAISPAVSFNWLLRTLRKGGIHSIEVNSTSVNRHFHHESGLRST